MKFYLSSYHLCRNPERLNALLTGKRTVGVIQNALDNFPDRERRRASLEREFSDLQKLGLEPEELDLRNFFDSKNLLEKQICKLGCLWVTGGNTFVLRRAFAESGLDVLLGKKLHEDDFVYAGYSAGVCVLAPTLKGIHLADDPDAEPAGYAPGVIWSGLNFIPFCIAPHYKSQHPESGLIDRSVEYFIENKVPFITLRDGESVTLDSRLPDVH